MDNGSTLSAEYLQGTLTYYAHVKANTWMGIGYGNSMTNTDEVIWAVGPGYDGGNVYDTFSTEAGRPT